MREQKWNFNLDNPETQQGNPMSLKELELQGLSAEEKIKFVVKKGLFTDRMKKELLHDAVNKAGKKHYLKTELSFWDFLEKDNAAPKLEEFWGVHEQKCKISSRFCNRKGIKSVDECECPPLPSDVSTSRMGGICTVYQND